jgi:hypothetical protein
VRTPLPAAELAVLLPLLAAEHLPERGVQTPLPVDGPVPELAVPLPPRDPWLPLFLVRSSRWPSHRRWVETRGAPRSILRWASNESDRSAAGRATPSERTRSCSSAHRRSEQGSAYRLLLPDLAQHPLNKHDTQHGTGGCARCRQSAPARPTTCLAPCAADSRGSGGRGLPGRCLAVRPIHSRNPAARGSRARLPRRWRAGMAPPAGVPHRPADGACRFPGARHGPPALYRQRGSLCRGERVPLECTSPSWPSCC